MTSENGGDEASRTSFLGGVAFTALVLSGPVLWLLTTGRLDGPLGLGDDSAATSSGLVQAMNINIVSIGGWNVWWFIAFWMLSQCIHFFQRLYLGGNK